MSAQPGHIAPGCESIIRQPAKRQKLRKGTFSCLECKRRKKRCIFASPTATVCTLCFRFGIECRSQCAEHARSESISKRLQYVESLVQQLVERKQSLSAYLNSVLPVPATAAILFSQGKSAFGWMWPKSRANITLPPDEKGLYLRDPAVQPVILARILLGLALCLIQPIFKVSRPAELQLPDEAPNDTADRYAGAARRATSEDALVQSIDGVETLLLQGLYEVHVGNMQAGYTIFRRTLSIAYRMRLNQLPTTADERTRFLWFRVAYVNQWFALGAGMPSPLTASDATSFLDTDEPNQKVDQLHLGIAGRIIHRNVRLSGADKLRVDEAYVITEMHDIDESLKRVSRSVPVHHWALPDIVSLAVRDVGEITGRLMTQIHQNFLILACHQPSLLKSLCHKANNDCNAFGDTHCKVASACAARELLLRLPAFLKFPHTPISLKGLMYKVFLAASTTTLLHLDAHGRGYGNSLEHQRASDLNLIAEIIKHLDNLYDQSQDEVGMATINALKLLLKAEEDAAQGARYNFWSEWFAGVDGDSETAPKHCTVSISYTYFGKLLVYKSKGLE